MTPTAAIVRGCLQVCGLPMGSERLLDPFIAAADRALRAIAAPAHASRPYPGAPGTSSLDEAQRRESAALMRVNHAGEVAAQALSHGQALAARAPATANCSSRPPGRRPITWGGANRGCGNWDRDP